MHIWLSEGLWNWQTEDLTSSQKPVLLAQGLTEKCLVPKSSHVLWSKDPVKTEFFSCSYFGSENSDCWVMMWCNLYGRLWKSLLEVKFSFTCYQFCDNAVVMQILNCNEVIGSWHWWSRIQPLLTHIKHKFDSVLSRWEVNSQPQLYLRAFWPQKRKGPTAKKVTLCQKWRRLNKDGSASSHPEQFPKGTHFKTADFSLIFSLQTCTTHTPLFFSTNSPEARRVWVSLKLYRGWS